MSTTVQTYRVGVQNRYSAFLEGEEGLALSNLVKKTTNVAASGSSSSNNKPRSATGGPAALGKSGSSKSNGKSEATSKSTNANKKQDAQGKNPSSVVSSPKQGPVRSGGDPARRQQRDGVKNLHHQQHQQSSGTQSQHAKYQNRNRNHNQEQNGSSHEGPVRVARSQTNGTTKHQDESQQQQQQQQQPQSKENRVVRNANGNPRLNRPRQFQNGADRKPAADHHAMQQQQSGHLASNEGDKGRAQQRRTINPRFKEGSEKRERRPQVAPAESGGDSQAQTATMSEQPTTEGEPSPQGPRGPPRPRREPGDKNQDTRNKAQQPRPRRPPGQMTNGDQQQQQQQPGGERRDIVKRDRPTGGGGPRPRAGFAGGPAHSELAGARQDRRPRPIPNFSDKSDFPSLAS